MSRQLRRDPTTGTLVLIAPERLHRPVNPVAPGLPKVSVADCPFCPGHEESTGPTLAEVARGDEWLVRAVANRFPALMVETELERRARGPYDAIAGTGAHEVIIEGADHHTPRWEQDREVLRQSLGVVRERMRDLSGDTRLKYLAWFRNHGVRSGSSQPHPHSQIVGLPEVPALQQRLYKHAADAFARTGRSLYQDVLDFERDERVRVLFDGPITALCPFASSAPFEVWLVPSKPGADFRAASDTAVKALADSMGRVLAAIAGELPDLAYNAVLYTGPLHRGAPGFRWHVRLLPRVELGGGLDAATGVCINGVPPEKAAELLRARLSR